MTMFRRSAETDVELTEPSGEFGLKLEFDAVLEEYRVLQSQIRSHVTNQQQIMNFAIAIAAGLIALSQLVSATAPIAQIIEEGQPILLVVSFIYSAFALYQLWHDVGIAYHIGYINSELRPRMEGILGKAQGEDVQVWRWQTRLIREQLSAGWQTPILSLIGISRYTLTVIPSLALVAIYFSTRLDLAQAPTWEVLLLLGALLGNFTVIVAALYSAYLYSRRLPSFEEK